LDACIAVVLRDRYSVVTRCLAGLEAQGLDKLPTLVVADEAPARLRAEWTSRFPWVEFAFVDRPLNGGEARNVALERASAPVIAVFDADLQGEPGWLDRCRERLRDTGAAAVGPVVVYDDGTIHTAGNLEYATVKDGVQYVFKEMRYMGLPYLEDSALEPALIDYAEYHCMVIDVEAARAVGGFDSAMPEFGEIDFGRRLRSAGCEVWVEPSAVVHVSQEAPVELDDIPLFIRRWDPVEIGRGGERFREVWGVDVEERGVFDDFLRRYNGNLGPLPRRWPEPWALAVDRGVRRTGRGMVRAGRQLASRARLMFGT
jgi:glycosyltransferase involved in cell wall biosynthesis